MKALHMISFILVIIGGLNWGLIGLGRLMGDSMGWDVVSMLLGDWPDVVSIVYLLVGLAAVWLLATHYKDCRMCAGSGSPMM